MRTIRGLRVLLGPQPVVRWSGYAGARVKPIGGNMDGRTPAGDGFVDRSSRQPADAAPHSLDAPPPTGRRVELPPPPRPPRMPPRPSDAPRTQEHHRPVKFAPQLATESGTEPWVDLADNRPEEGTRHQAQVEREELSRRITTVGARTLRVLDAKTEERAWRVGADGEEAIGKLLAKLARRGYMAIHSIPVGQRGSDIDHLLMAPPGSTPSTPRTTKARRSGSQAPP